MNDVRHPKSTSLRADWLATPDAEPGQADQSYRELLDDLTRFLEWLGCIDPAEVAAESVFRGLKRMAAGVDTSDSGPRAYIWGIAKRVAHEGWKRQGRERQVDQEAWDRRPSTSRDQEGTEAAMMLEDIERLLSPSDRDILFRYCTETDHAAHCLELGVAPGYLRVIVHRIREYLKTNALPERQRSSRKRG